MNLVHTCGWIEWLTDGVLVDDYAPYFYDVDHLITPTSARFHRASLITSDKHFQGLPDVIYFKKN